jgi:hypothetical protein
MYKSKPEVVFNPEVSTELVLVCVEGLAQAFFRGVDKFVVDVFTNKGKARIAEQRFTKLCHTLPFKDYPELKSVHQQLSTDEGDS